MDDTLASTTIGRHEGATRRWFRSLLIASMLAALSLGCATTKSLTPEEQQTIKQADALRDVGADHLTQGRTAMAIRKLQQAHSKNPKDAETLLWLGEAFRRKGMLDRAEENMLRAIELSENASDFTYQETVLNLSALYIQMNRYRETRELCQRLIDDPTFSSPWRPLTNRGWAEFQMGLYAEARKSYEAALDFFPSYWPAHLNLGILEQKEGRFLAAIQSFDRALATERMGYDAAAEANYRMAEIYVSLGKRREAIEHFRVALERSPNGEWGEQSKTYLEMLQ